MLFGLIFGVACTLASLVAYNLFVFVKGRIRLNKLIKMYPNGNKINDEQVKACRHKWNHITLAIRQVPPGKYDVCSECGYISGTNYQLNKPGIDSLREGLIKQKQLADEKKYLKERLDEEIARRRNIWIDQNLSKFSGVQDVVNDEDTKKYCQDLLIDYGNYMVKSYDDAADKVMAEKEARS